jgi:hypothetical protein
VTVTKVIQYRTRPECADENEGLIRAVFAELAESKPEGLRYASFRREDGVSFLHVAVLDDGEINPLLESAAFGEFVTGIGSRCAEAPITTDATVVGSYRLVSPE